MDDKEDEEEIVKQQKHLTDHWSSSSVARLQQHNAPKNHRTQNRRKKEGKKQPKIYLIEIQSKIWGEFEKHGVFLISRKVAVKYATVLGKVTDTVFWGTTTSCSLIMFDVESREVSREAQKTNELRIAVDY